VKMLLTCVMWPTLVFISTTNFTHSQGLSK
jgi:hypothetical protein